jgi:hypothetical protein
MHVSPATYHLVEGNAAFSRLVRYPRDETVEEWVSTRWNTRL